MDIKDILEDIKYIFTDSKVRMTVKDWLVIVLLFTFLEANLTSWVTVNDKQANIEAEAQMEKVLLLYKFLEATK